MQNISAQKIENSLVGRTFVSNVDYICEVTVEPEPCAGLQVYLVLEFSKNKVVVIEKEISGCDDEYITFNQVYEWRIENTSEIIIESKPREVEYAFVKGLILKIENSALVGYKELFSKETKEYNFEELMTKK